MMYVQLMIEYGIFLVQSGQPSSGRGHYHTQPDCEGLANEQLATHIFLTLSWIKSKYYIAKRHPQVDWECIVEESRH